MSTRTAPYNHQTTLALRTAGTIPVRYTTADEAATGRTHRGMPRTGDPRKLFVIPCGAFKLADPGMRFAHERYCSAHFRLALKAADATVGRNRVRILSAHYGLMSPDRLTEYYDQKMDAARAAELVSSTYQRLAGERGASADLELVCALPKLYLSVLETAIAEWPGGDSGIRITNLFEGARGIGDQRSVLSALANA